MIKQLHDVLVDADSRPSDLMPRLFNPLTGGGGR